MTNATIIDAIKEGQPMQVTIRTKRGRRETHVIGAWTLACLQQAVSGLIRTNDYSVSDIGASWRVKGHPAATRISYNGRFWDASDSEVFE